MQIEAFSNSLSFIQLKTELLSSMPDKSWRVWMRHNFKVLVAGLIGFILVYGSEVLAEFVGNTGLVLFLRNDVGIPITLLRIAILSITASPIAYLTAWALVRCVPALSVPIITVIALLYTAVISLLQFYLYEPSVLVSSILKVTFVVVPLGVVAYRKRTMVL